MHFTLLFEVDTVIGNVNKYLEEISAYAGNMNSSIFRSGESGELFHS